MRLLAFFSVLAFSAAASGICEAKALLSQSTNIEIKVGKGNIKPVDLQIPSHEKGVFDPNGVPNQPLFLEISYVDNFGADERPEVAILLDRKSDELLAASIGYYTIGRLGDGGNGAQRTFQRLFDTTPFPLIRAISDKVTVAIKQASDRPFTINYIGLYKMDRAEAQGFKDQMLSVRGITTVSMPDDGAARDIWKDSDLPVVFIRDSAHAIYGHTIPGGSDLAYPNGSDKKTMSFEIITAPGETEAINLGVYTGSRKNMAVKAWLRYGSNVHDLDIYKVEEMLKRSAPYTYVHLRDGIRPAAVFHDYLVDAKPMDHDGNNRRSFAYWLKFRIPQSAAGGVYEGVIDVTWEGGSNKVPFRVKVLPIALDPPKHLNVVYWDPYTEELSIRFNEAMKPYIDAGLSPIIMERDGDITVSTGFLQKNVSFDMSRLESKIVKLSSGGLIKKSAFIVIWKAPRDLCSKIGIPEEAQCYKNPDFISQFGRMIDEMNRMAGKYGVQLIYNFSHEPMDNGFRRFKFTSLATIAKAGGAKTWTEYHLKADNVVTFNGDELPPLSDYADFKVWAQYEQNEGYEKSISDPSRYGGFGYYTTNTSYLSHPAYNRFVHGLLAYRSDADVVAAFAMGAMIGDPFDDFDPDPQSAVDFPDVLFLYPTWEGGKMLPRLALEGIREGIKDAKYLATLERLLLKDTSSSAVKLEALDFLNQLKLRVDRNFWQAYVKRSNQYGFLDPVFAAVSSTNNTDGEAFAKLRSRIAGYIEALTEQGAPAGGEDVPKDAQPVDEKAGVVTEPKEVGGVSPSAAPSAGCSLVYQR